MADLLINVSDYERAAAKRIETGPLGYFAGGAGDERTLRRNVAAYSEWELVPRVLVDVSAVDCSIELFGADLAMPLAVAPVAFQRLVNEAGEEAMARAAGAAGTAMCLSTIATATPSSVAAAAPDTTKWFQLYVFRDRGVTEALLAEAIESGYEAIFLTVDAPFAGKRERDLRAGFEVDVDAPSVTAALGSDRPVSVAEVFGLVDASFDWDGLASLVAGCEVPVVVKGLMHPTDAELAIEAGAGGIVVSNHGGRQLDGSPAPVDAFPAVADAVDGRVPVLIDGGIRRGTDVLVALALGADAVLVGRPALWGLAVDGEAGARAVLEILSEEIRLGLALLGAPSVGSVNRSHVQRATRD